LENKCAVFETLDSCYGYHRSMSDDEIDALIASLENLRQDLIAVSGLLGYIERAIDAWEKSPSFVGPNRNPLVQAPPLPAHEPGFTRAPTISPSPPGISPTHVPGTNSKPGFRVVDPVPPDAGITGTGSLPTQPGFSSSPPGFLAGVHLGWETLMAKIG